MPTGMPQAQQLPMPGQPQMNQVQPNPMQTNPGISGLNAPPVDPAQQEQELALQQQMLQTLDPQQKSMFEGLPPEQKAQFLTLLAGDFGGQAASAEQDMGRADALRQTAAPEGRSIGNTYVAANPLEHISRSMQLRQGQKDYGAAKEARTKAGTDAEATRRQVMDMVANRSQALRQQ